MALGFVGVWVVAGLPGGVILNRRRITGLVDNGSSSVPLHGCGRLCGMGVVLVRWGGG